MEFQRDDYQVGVCKLEAVTIAPSESGGSTVQGSYPSFELVLLLEPDNQIPQYFGVLLPTLKE